MALNNRVRDLEQRVEGFQSAIEELMKKVAHQDELLAKLVQDAQHDVQPVQEEPVPSVLPPTYEDVINAGPDQDIIVSAAKPQKATRDAPLNARRRAVT
jgi:uncharacterized coiled-coil protein SlyX